MKILIRCLFLSTCIISGSTLAQSNTWSGSIQAGVGVWMGDATYSIGGHAWTPEEGSVQLPDKISELTFPLDVAYGSVGGSLIWKNKIEFFGTFTENLTDPSTKMKDSDWGVFGDSGSLDIYSESDASLTAISVEAGGRYWFSLTAQNNRVACSMGIGPSLLYQHLDWTIRNADQWYPSRPWIDHDTQSGVVATYNTDIVMPYLNASVIVRFKRLSGNIEVGIGPALVSDTDDHILRQKRSTADMIGAGIKGAAELRYQLTQHGFILGRVSALSIQATGTSTDRGYGGDLAGYYAEIDEDFSLISLNAGLAAGCRF